MSRSAFIIVSYSDSSSSGNAIRGFLGELIGHETRDTEDCSDSFEFLHADKLKLGIESLSLAPQSEGYVYHSSVTLNLAPTKYITKITRGDDSAYSLKVDLQGQKNHMIPRGRVLLFVDFSRHSAFTDIEEFLSKHRASLGHNDKVCLVGCLRDERTRDVTDEEFEELASEYSITNFLIVGEECSADVKRVHSWIKEPATPEHAKAASSGAAVQSFEEQRESVRAVLMANYSFFSPHSRHWRAIGKAILRCDNPVDMKSLLDDQCRLLVHGGGQQFFRPGLFDGGDAEYSKRFTRRLHQDVEGTSPLAVSLKAASKKAG
ncbi:MAG: hypothetical protein K0U29_06335 [Gammaproteobacteria bacterium]|nr:hypothetical protein [Gammaproteobacteria bacterium]